MTIPMERFVVFFLVGHAAFDSKRCWLFQIIVMRWWIVLTSNFENWTGWCQVKCKLKFDLESNCGRVRIGLAVPACVDTTSWIESYQIRSLFLQANFETAGRASNQAGLPTEYHSNSSPFTSMVSQTVLAHVFQGWSSRTPIDKDHM